MKYKKVIISILSLISIYACVDARSRRTKKITSERSFDKFTRQGLVIALFYNQGKKPRKRDATDQEMAQWEQLNNNNKDLLAMFSAESKDFLYEEVDLFFITINVAKRAELAELAKHYNITQFPTFMLFNFGRPIRGALGSPVKLTSFIREDALNTFIKENIGQKLEERKKEKAEYRKKKLEEAKIRSYYAPYWYWGYGYPYYWGWGYPYGYGWGYWW